MLMSLGKELKKHWSSKPPVAGCCFGTGQTIECTKKKGCFKSIDMMVSLLTSCPRFLYWMAEMCPIFLQSHAQLRGGSLQKISPHVNTLHNMPKLFCSVL